MNGSHIDITTNCHTRKGRMGLICWVMTSQMEISGQKQVFIWFIDDNLSKRKFGMIWGCSTRDRFWLEPWMKEQPKSDYFNSGQILSLCQISNFNQNSNQSCIKFEWCAFPCLNCSGFDLCGRIKLRPAKHFIIHGYHLFSLLPPRYLQLIKNENAWTDQKKKKTHTHTQIGIFLSLTQRWHVLQFEIRYQKCIHTRDWKILH